MFWECLEMENSSSSLENHVPKCLYFAWQLFLRTRSSLLEYILYVLIVCILFQLTKNWDATQSNKMNYWSCKPFWIFAVMQMCLGFHSKLQTVVKKHCYSPTDLSAAHSKDLCSTGWTCCCSEKPCFCTESDMEWNSKESFGHPFFSHCSCLQKCMRNSWVHFKNLPKCSLGPDKYRNSKSLLSVPRNHSLPIDVCNPTPTHSQLQV